MFNKIYELPMVKEYVSHWGLSEAVRELIQNALDNESPFEWEFKNDKLLIKSKYAELKPETLLLGKTSKSDDKDAIGSFGEGYKIAMLVLTREGYPVIIRNRSVTWAPKFMMNKKFNSETLHIIEENAVNNNEGVTFEISDLSETDIEEIKLTCLYMQKIVGETMTTSNGDILIEQAGKLYVGGLFICDTQMKYGYNIKPEFLKLERDRQTVNDFDLQLLTKDMWFEAGDPDKVAELMEEECTDLEYADWSTPEVVREACYRLFQQKHPNAIIAESNTELKKMVAEGMTNVVYIRGSYSGAIKSSDSYKGSVAGMIKVATVHNELEFFFNKNRKYMKRQAIVDFKLILDKSKDWRK